MSSLLPALPAPFSSRTDLLAGDPQYLQQLLQDPAITEAQWRKMEEWSRQNATAPVQPSILCKDGDCLYINSCPLKRAEIPRPTGQPCVIEETVKRNWLHIYLGEIGDSADGFKVVDSGMVIDLVSTLLDIYRAQAEVSDMPNVAERVLRGFDEDGKPFTDLKMNPLHFYLANARKLKLKILEQLVATRDARKKDKSRQTQDASKLMSEMRQLLDTLSAQNTELEEQLRVARVRVIETDEEPDGAAPTV